LSDETARIVPINLEDELRNAYLDYSMSVIVSRALPDVRDGLKPVQRRILVAMRELNLMHDRKHRKSAKITGDVTGNYHPHGTAAVYDTMVRMAQDCSLRDPLVDGQGNFGSVDGDRAAAERYTEARLTELSENLLTDIEKETVDHRPNYEETRQEPVVLPGRFPNLLVNGATGIAVGMATNIPPHNLGEMVDGLCLLLENPEATLDDLMQHVKGPDFPTAGIIQGTAGIQQAYATGRGHIRVRARAEIETNERTGRDRILITELPYQVNKAALLEKIAHLVKAGTIPGIADIRDESDRKGMRAVIEIKKDGAANVILNQLYKHTAMQSTFGANMVALVNMRPKVMPLKELMSEFLKHRIEVVLRRTRYELDQAEKRAHILEGLRKALDHIDAIITTIRNAPDVGAARAGLMTGFELTEVQANAILDMRLQRLTGLERKKLDEEYRDLIEEIGRLKGILESEARQHDVVREELLEIRSAFADERRTEINVIEGEEFVDEDLIPEEDMVVTISNLGYIKRIPLSTYRAQKRGGRGITAATTRDEDFTQDLFVASTHTYILFFTDRGRCYWLKVYAIPTGGRTARGKAIVNCIQIGSDERVTTYAIVTEFTDHEYLVLATAAGTVKRVTLSAFGNPRRAGIRAMNLAEGDTLISAAITSGDDDVILATRKGRAVRYHETSMRPMGRTAGGVRGITLDGDDDRVVGMVKAKEEDTLLTVTEKGYGKRTPVGDYRLTNRGGKGVINMKVTDRNGKVVGLAAVQEDDQVMIITNGGVVIRSNVSDVRVMGRSVQGVRVINVGDDAKVADLARVPRADDDDDQEPEDRTPPRPSDSAGTTEGGPVSEGGTPGAATVAEAQKFADELVREAEEDEAEDDADQGPEDDDV